MIISPVFDSFEEDAKIVGTLSAVVTWQIFFEDLLVQGAEPIHAVLVNKCDPEKTYTFYIEGNEAKFLGDGYDAHDRKYNDMGISTDFASFAYSEEYLAGVDGCTYTLTVYPAQAFESSFTTNKPLIYAFSVLGVFFFTALAFFAFDWLVQRRQKALAWTAARQNGKFRNQNREPSAIVAYLTTQFPAYFLLAVRTSAIVSSLFPKKIHMKLMQEAEEAAKQKRMTIGKAGLRRYLTEANTLPIEHDEKTKPIADLFSETTIMFGKNFQSHLLHFFDVVVCDWLLTPIALFGDDLSQFHS